MKVEIKDEDGLIINLNIVFYRSKPKERRHVGKKELIDTHCKVFRHERCIAHSIAMQNPKDNYNKIIGRKVALAKAIKKLSFLDYYECLTSTNSHRRSMRQHLWNTFIQTFM